MQILSVEGGNESIGSKTTEITVSAPGVTEKSVILITQAPNGIEENRALRVASVTAGKRFVVKTSAGENKVSFYWIVFD